MATNEIIKKDYNSLDNIISLWYEKLCEQGGLCVAISRKAPRLLEWCANKFGHGNELEVITEIALPFVDISNRKSCILTDEAIYHGTTFSMIYDLIKAIAPAIEILPEPLVVAENVCFNVGDDVTVINEENICFFIDTIIKRFHEGIKPYDIEYPLVYMDLGHEVNEDDMKSSLEILSCLESIRTGRSEDLNYYTTETYSRETGKLTKSYSYIFEYMFNENTPNYLKPDFAKLRLNFKGNIVAIAVMSPYILTDIDLDNSEMIFSGAFSLLWKRICDALVNDGNADGEYEYQVRKSLTILANYLLSYNNYLILKENIKMAFGAKEVWIDTQDIAYLTGQELALSVKDILDEITEPMSVTRLYPLSSDIDTSYMPIAYRDAYIQKVGAANLKASNISELISNQFSTMHWDVEINSRKNSPDEYYSRLRFGESYSSLFERYKYNSNNSRLEIHKNIDKRVDSGSIVPNYVRVEKNPGYWMRLFRSGENEDLMIDQFNRVVLDIFRQYKKVSGNSSMPYLAIQLILTLLEYLDKDRCSRFFGFEIGIDDSEMTSSPYIIIDDNKTDVLIRMATSRLFGTNGKSALILLDNANVLRYKTSNPLSAEQEQEITDAVEFVNDLCVNIVSWDILKSLRLFNLLKFDIDKFELDVDNFVGSIKKDINTGISDHTRDHNNTFIRLFTLIPNEDNIIERMTDSYWKTVFYDLFNKFKGNISNLREIESKLFRALYINCFWGLKMNGNMNNDIVELTRNKEINNYFSIEEVEILTNSSYMTVEDFKRHVLIML